MGACYDSDIHRVREDTVKRESGCFLKMAQCFQKSNFASAIKSYFVLYLFFSLQGSTIRWSHLDLCKSFKGCCHVEWSINREGLLCVWVKTTVWESSAFSIVEFERTGWVERYTSEEFIWVRVCSSWEVLSLFVFTLVSDVVALCSVVSKIWAQSLVVGSGLLWTKFRLMVRCRWASMFFCILLVPSVFCCML